MVAIIDDDGRLGYVSDGAARLLGYPDGELVGTDAFDLVHPDDQASMRSRVSIRRSLRRLETDTGVVATATRRRYVGRV